MIRAGAPEKVAIQISGHKTASRLWRDNITDTRDVKDAGKRTERYLEAKKEDQHAENLRSTSVLKPAKWCPGRDLNPHSACAKKDFKSFASADFATRASVSKPGFSPHAPSASASLPALSLHHKAWSLKNAAAVSIPSGSRRTPGAARQRRSHALLEENPWRRRTPRIKIFEGDGVTHESYLSNQRWRLASHASGTGSAHAKTWTRRSSH